MKHVFVILFALCSLWAVAVWFLSPTHESDLPLMYWVTDGNPVRAEQVGRFAGWMNEHGYPEADLRLDTSNSDITKKVIQGVSGVGADLMDLPSDQLSFFVRMGLLVDVTDKAQELGFGVDKTYAALGETITVNGRQYAFPANVDVGGLVINTDQLKKVGVAVPSGKWTQEAFEKTGLEYVRKANAGLPLQRFWFSGPIVDRITLLRGIGGSMLNETMTAARLDSPEYAQMLNTLRRWIELGIIPSAAEVQSMSTDSGYGGATLQLFNGGNYAMIQIGRHAIIQLRELGSEVDFTVVPAPHGGFPNVMIRTRMVGVYSGARHPELAPYFLAYLASDQYNETVVSSGDALPPSPQTAMSETYLRPEGRQNEWDFHNHFAEYARDIAIPLAVSPYILPSILTRVERDAHDSVMANLYTAQEAGRIAQSRLDRELNLFLREHPEMHEEYAIWSARQREIDALKAAGKKIPAALIRNPFHLAYYRHLGLLDEAPDGAAPATSSPAH